MPKLHTVYDFRTDQTMIPGGVYLFLILAAFGLFFFFYTKQASVSDSTRTQVKYWTLGIGSLSFLIFTGVAATSIRDYYEVKKALDRKQYSVVEGRVQEFHPMPSSGHDTEHFRVGDLYFTMSDFDDGIIGYNHAASLGGAIRPNLYVRIWYPTYGRIAILHLETE